jgi:hypothetical protein
MWFLETRIGTFSIKPDMDKRGWYNLNLDGFHLGDYHSRQSAVQAVNERKTGWDPWDSLSDPSFIPDESDWVMEES